MDPYKVLGLSGRQVKGSGDLDTARHRAKKLFKRYVSEKKKFDAKKVLEAFDMIKQKLKNKPGEGAYKILGRSRKERELDKHFNHQTKEIKQNKDLKRALQRAKRGEKRIHLPGDKERIPRPRRKRRRRASGRAAHVDALQGLQRLAAFLPQRPKFPKVVKLLHRWMREYMNGDNRELVLAVLQGVAQTDFILDDPDARQDVVAVFEYALGYFSSWFDEGDDRATLRRAWQVATVLASGCRTDDAFVLSATLGRLNEALCLLERHRDKLEAEPQPEEGRGAETPLAKTEADKKEPPGAKAEEAKQAERVKFPDTEVKDETTRQATAKTEGEGVAEHTDVKEEDSNRFALPVACLSEAGASPGVLASPPSDDDQDVLGFGGDEVESLGSSEDIESLGSTDDDVKEDPIDLDGSSDDADVKEEEISSDCSPLGEGDSGSDVEIEECPAFSVPSTAASLRQLRRYFVDRCLAALFQHRGPLWARPKIDAFFQDVFYRRSIFGEHQRQVEAWQARIKDLQKLGDRDVGEANNPLEAHRPVKDSREERFSLDADSNVWAAKQTFDSRDTCGARNVIR
mmetsp:Transcript_30223/g.86606  ORF Transcript_30223/g.86606 Transcript_30223/m.86606 type:complete len:572 (+) Transcript_30223:28-1743(+)